MERASLIEKWPHRGAKYHDQLFVLPRAVPRKLMPDQRRDATARRDAGKETLMGIARSCNVSHSTISGL